MEKIALIPGTFDPITIGHMELIRVAAALFDKVIVCIFVNPEKKHLFDEEKRLSLLRAAVVDYPNVSVDIDHGMTADYAARVGASYLIRGIRDEKDTPYELKMAEFNKNRTGVQTLFIPAPEALAGVSSTLVREKLSDGENVEALLPKNITSL